MALRTQMLSLKKGLQQLDQIEEQKTCERFLEGDSVNPIYTPQRNRKQLVFALLAVHVSAAITRQIHDAV